MKQEFPFLNIHQLNLDFEECIVMQENAFSLHYDELLAFFQASKELTQAQLRLAKLLLPEKEPLKGPANFEEFEARLIDDINAFIATKSPKGLSTLLRNLAYYFECDLSACSRLLHFLNPEIFPVWTNQTIEYATGKRPYYYLTQEMISISEFEEYVRVCNDIVHDPAFEKLKTNVQETLPHPAAAMRILEIIMLSTPPRSGLRTLAEIFEEKPFQYGLRGDAPLWRELTEIMGPMPFPKTKGKLEKMIHENIAALIDEPLTPNSRPFVKRFNSGGMSGGRVSGEFWLEKGIPMLLDRFALATLRTDHS